MLRRIITLLLCLSFACTQAGFAQIIDASRGAAMPGTSITGGRDGFRPMHLRSLAYDGAGASLDVLMDQGSSTLSGGAALAQAREAMKYFLIGIALPDDTFWVNLRPDASSRMIDDTLALTDMGKALLEADLQLKKDTAAFTSPQTREGKAYWDRLYKKAEELFGTDAANIPTVSRPWIVPGEIIIREAADSAYIYKATLAVKLEQDRLKGSPEYTFTDERLCRLNEYSAQLLRELVLPTLVREVNTAARYAPLRQVYYSLIIAAWFKKQFRGKPGAYSALIDRKTLDGLMSEHAWEREEYFRAYKRSFEKGEYSLRETVHTAAGTRERTYCSGGISFSLSGEPGTRAIMGAEEAHAIQAKKRFFPALFGKFTRAFTAFFDGKTIGVNPVRPSSPSGDSPDGMEMQASGPVRSVSEVLLDYLKAHGTAVSVIHPVDIYAAAFRGFPLRAKGVLGWGKDSVAIELEDDRVLKISKRKPFSARRYEPSFDTELIDQGAQEVGGKDVHYIIQPKLDMTVTSADIVAFQDRIRPYRFEDIFADQIGFNKRTGRLELADGDAVVRTPGLFAPVIAGVSSSTVMRDRGQLKKAEAAVRYIKEHIADSLQPGNPVEMVHRNMDWDTLRAAGRFPGLRFKRHHFYPRLAFELEVHELSVAAAQVQGTEMSVGGFALLSLPGIVPFRYCAGGAVDGTLIMQDFRPATDPEDVRRVTAVLAAGGIAGRRITVDDIGIVEQNGARVPVLVNLQKVFVTGKRLNAAGTGEVPSTARDGGNAAEEKYFEDIKAGTARGIITYLPYENALARKYSHLPEAESEGAGLQHDNMRRLSQNGERVLDLVMRGKDGSRILDVGAGAGKACADMYIRAREAGREIALELVGLTPVAPSFLLRFSWEGLAALAPESVARSPSQLLDFAFSMQADGIPVFEVTHTPFIQREYIGEFLDPALPLSGQFDFIYDSFGGVYYSTREKNGLRRSMDKIFSLMSGESIFLCDRLSLAPMRELSKGGYIPADTVGFISLLDDSVMFFRKQSGHYSRVQPYLSSARQVSDNLYLLNDFQGLFDSLEGKPADLQCTGMFDWVVRGLVTAADRGERAAWERFNRYAKEFPHCSAQLGRLALNYPVPGSLNREQQAEGRRDNERDGGMIRVTQGGDFTVDMENSPEILNEFRLLARAITAEYDKDGEFGEDMGLIIGAVQDGTYRITRLARITEFTAESKPEYLLPSPEGLVRLIDANVRKGEKVLGTYHNHSYMRLLSGAKPGPSGPDLPGLADVLMVPGRQDMIVEDLLGIVLEPEVPRDLPFDQISLFHPRDSRVLVYSWVTHARGGRENYEFDLAPNASPLDSLAPSRDGGKGQDLGGIDLRALRPRLHVLGADGEAGLPGGRRSTPQELEQEWRRVSRLADGGLRPSARRIGEFVAGCRLQGEMGKYTGALLACIAGLLRAEEEDPGAPDDGLWEIAVFLEENVS